MAPPPGIRKPRLPPKHSSGLSSPGTVGAQPSLHTATSSSNTAPATMEATDAGHSSRSPPNLTMAKARKMEMEKGSSSMSTSPRQQRGGGPPPVAVGGKPRPPQTVAQQAASRYQDPHHHQHPRTWTPPLRSHPVPATGESTCTSENQHHHHPPAMAHPRPPRLAEAMHNLNYGKHDTESPVPVQPLSSSASPTASGASPDPIPPTTNVGNSQYTTTTYDDDTAQHHPTPSTSVPEQQQVKDERNATGGTSSPTGGGGLPTHPQPHDQQPLYSQGIPGASRTFSAEQRPDGAHIGDAHLLHPSTTNIPGTAAASTVVYVLDPEHFDFFRTMVRRLDQVG